MAKREGATLVIQQVIMKLSHRICLRYRKGLLTKVVPMQQMTVVKTDAMAKWEGVTLVIQELGDIEIGDDLHRDQILEHIKRLPPNTFRSRIPDDTEDWLTRIRLIHCEDDYLTAFLNAGYKEKEDLARLKSCNLDQLFENIGIRKKGHIKRLKESIAYMREPSDEEKLQEKIEKLMKEKPAQDMSEAEPLLKKQHRMWERLANGCLRPDQDTDNFNSNNINADTLKVELGELRDSAIKVLAAVNVLWLVVIVALARSEVLHISGHNPLGILSLFVFGVIQVIQFLAMLYHRTMSFLHWVARADIEAENRETE
uniref:SAM domain-containing protein n=1 Tax=Branchiostoma floridae TaxID=7739 RepID=C3Y4T4_BRAFL|eukprot:XP_002608731.1 hypothetical protein BRAFLDRAFT_73952 [Branchiostoma floridae]